MRYAPDQIDLVVVVDPPRRRFRLLLPVSTAVDSETTALRNAYIAAIRAYVNRMFVKEGQASGGNFNATAAPDGAGWVIVP